MSLANEANTTSGYEVGGPVEIVSISLTDINPGLRIRSGDISHSHVELLAELGGAWPPIVVTKIGHSIIDGQYRYLAARALGFTQIICRLFYGGQDAAFVESVRLNIEHGLPLTLQERKNSAQHVLKINRSWSDRRIAQICGLSSGTVAGLRMSLVGAKCSTGEFGCLDRREGRDHRYRPANNRELRDRISAALATRPNGSLRDIARSVGASPETVRKVRQESAIEKARHDTGDMPAEPHTSADLCTDLAFASTTAGREFAGWFERADIVKDWPDYITVVPMSRIYDVADQARGRARAWVDFATALENRSRTGVARTNH